MQTMDHPQSSFYEPTIYEYSGAYRGPHHQYGHHNPQNMQNVPHIPQGASHHRRDSSVSIGLEHAPSQVSFGHQPQSPPLRQAQQAQQQQQQQQTHHHHQHQQSMSSRPRSTSAATVELSGAGSSSMMHDSRPRAHSYADPRAAADQRAKHSQTPTVDDIGFGSTNAVQELDEEPLYVNAKQYHRILKRRAARARLAEIQKLSSQRKPYLHQSRHNHAIRRPRGPGGRFLTAEEIAARKAQSQNEQNGDEDGGINESPISPTQESVSSPQDGSGSPLSPMGDKSSNSLTATASAVFGYPTGTVDTKSVVEHGEGGVNGLNFDAEGLSSILEAPLGQGYNFGGGEQ